MTKRFKKVKQSETGAMAKVRGPVHISQGILLIYCRQAQCLLPLYGFIVTIIHW